MRPSGPARVVFLVALAATYFGAGKLGLSLAFVNASASAVWPPTGIALAAFLVFGAGVWPAILAGAFFVNLTTSGLLVSSAAIAVGNTLEGAVGSWLVKRFAGGVGALRTPEGTFRFAALAGALSTTIAATCGVISLALAGLASAGTYGEIWLTWWLGDAVGAVVVGPLLVLWSLERRPEWWRRARVWETALAMASLVVAALLVFGGVLPEEHRNHPLEFVPIPILLWAAFRIGRLTTAAASATLAGIAIWGTLGGYGPFVAASENQSLLLLQAFMGVITLAALATAAEASRRRETEDQVRRLNQELEGRIAARTEELQTSEARLREAQHVAHVGSWEWDVATDRIWWSEELYRMYGVEASSFPASYEAFLQYIHPEDRAFVDGVVRGAFESHEPFSMEHRIVRPDGTVRILYGRGRVAVDANGRPSRMFGTAQDITERKRADQQREELIREQAARREAEEANRLKDQFLAMLSHELRTPLNTVMGWAQLLAQDCLDESGRRRAVDLIQRNAAIQTQLLADLLDVSRIAAGTLRLNMEPVELATVIEAALETVRPSAMEKRIELVTTLDRSVAPVLGDPQRLQQVIWNLLTNATKFTPEGGRVLVRLMRVDSEVHIAVEDTGPGIDPDFRPYLFQQFRQADPSPTREHSGLGLGLAIARQIVELHGGSVGAANREGNERGAVFTVRLPAADANAPGTPAATSAVPTARG